MIVVRKLRAVIIALVFSLALSAHAAPPPGKSGVYLGRDRFICTDHSSCVHEIGHQLDDEAGWISSSSAFIGAIEWQMLTASAQAQDPGAFTTFTVFFYRDDRGPDPAILREFYARLFQAADGRPEQMPPVFRMFYDWDRASDLMDRYVN